MALRKPISQELKSYSEPHHRSQVHPVRTFRFSQSKNISCSWSGLPLARMIGNLLNVLRCPALKLAEELVHVHSYRPMSPAQYDTIALVSTELPELRQL